MRGQIPSALTTQLEICFIKNNEKPVKVLSKRVRSGGVRIPTHLFEEDTMQLITDANSIPLLLVP